MDRIAFIDTEIQSHRISDAGIVCGTLQKRVESSTELRILFEKCKAKFVCGHNFIKHDKKYLITTPFAEALQKTPIIDTLALSLLLYPYITTHKLEKLYRYLKSKDTIEIDIFGENLANNPLEDSKKCQELFTSLDWHFDKLDSRLKDIFVYLLSEHEYFKGYFAYKSFAKPKISIYDEIAGFFSINTQALKVILGKNDDYLSLALALSFVYFLDTHKLALSPYIVKNYPKTMLVVKALRNGITNLGAFVQKEFDFISHFKEFEPVDKTNLFAKKIYQKDIIECALTSNNSVLAILPTGGGKTITFQIPALIKAQEYRALSVVVSPLQALIKDQVDGFKNKNFKVAAISGFMNPMQRANTLSELRLGMVDIIYIAPESLRTKTVLAALKCRYIERVIIDEAHCISSWGHDFRHSYFFLEKTIKELEKNQKATIAVSCFSATAKPEVIDEIKFYFKKYLDKELIEFVANSERKNLKYSLEQTENEKKKFNILVQILLKRFREQRNNPTIIYIPQNAAKCKKIASELQNDSRIKALGLEIEAFYANRDREIEEELEKKLANSIEDSRRDSNENLKADSNEDSKKRKKEEVLRDFIADKIDIIVATTAFGMGIDKENIKNVIHYEPSSSLEAYLQESGRGARKSTIEAQCDALWIEKDFDAIFTQHTRFKVEYCEIREILGFIYSKFRTNKKGKIYVRLKEIAKGINLKDLEQENSYEVMINTALLELCKAEIIDYDKGTNVFATSVLRAKEASSMEAVHKILDSKKDAINARYAREINNMYELMIRIMQVLIGESKKELAIKVETLSEHANSPNDESTLDALHELSAHQLIAMENDLKIFLNKTFKKDMEIHFEIEKMILETIKEEISHSTSATKKCSINIKELLEKIMNTLLEQGQKTRVKKYDFRALVGIISHMKDLIKISSNNVNPCAFNISVRKNYCHFKIQNIARIETLINHRKKCCEFIATEILNILKEKQNEVMINTSRIKNSLERKNLKINVLGYHHCYVYLENMMSIFKSFAILQGRLIYDNKYEITKGKKWKEKEEELEILRKQNPEKKIYYRTEILSLYPKKSYNENLKAYYTRKIEGIHILSKFSDLLAANKNIAMAFVGDYFGMKYESFKNKYFNKSEQKLLKLPITKHALAKLEENLDPVQKEIIDDKTHNILVLAGPGSGKTKTLVHKIASLVTKEDNKPEHFLMLAHSRAAVAEFKSRLEKLIGNLVYSMTIMTFHAFAFDILSKNGKIADNNASEVIIEATKRLKAQILPIKERPADIEPLELPFITMLVLDEYQDVSENLYEFIKAIYAQMSEKKIIAVGDDDQCIGNYGGNKQDNANIAFIKRFEGDFDKEINDKKAHGIF